jgi:hypothetical protein
MNYSWKEVGNVLGRKGFPFNVHENLGDQPYENI